VTDSSLAPDVDTELLADLGVGIFTVDLTGRVRSSNRRAREVFALHDTVITADGLALAPYEVLDEHGQPLPFGELPLTRALRSGSSVAGVTLGFRPRGGGVTRWHLCGAHVVRPDGDDVEVVCTFVDVTEQRAAREALEERDRRFRHLAENSADMIFRSRISPELAFDYLNPAVEQVLGFPRADFYADFDFAIRLMHPDDRTTVWSYFGRILEGTPDTEDSVVLRLSRADGSVIWAQVRAAAVREGDEVVGIEGIVRDVTDMKAREADLHYQAMHDALTGIPNRASFLAALDGALDRERTAGGAVAVLYVDLDRFKTVNDGLGHDAGDRVLAALAARLAEVVRPSDEVGRIGGDEFAAVLSGLSDADEAAHVAARLLDALGEPLVLAEGALVTTASIGVAFTADCLQTSAELLRRADVAMYEAKDRGRSRVEHYEAPSSLGRGGATAPG
jgi:diguanylate cyclase (GGDEF)-like protein/PAS domain S-box-containing protein